MCKTTLIIFCRLDPEQHHVVLVSISASRRRLAHVVGQRSSVRHLLPHSEIRDSSMRRFEPSRVRFTRRVCNRVHQKARTDEFRFETFAVNLPFPRLHSSLSGVAPLTSRGSLRVSIRRVSVRSQAQLNIHSSHGGEWILNKIKFAAATFFPKA